MTTSLQNVIFYHHMYTCCDKSPMQLNERCNVQLEKQFYQINVLISLYFMCRCCHNISQYVEMFNVILFGMIYTYSSKDVVILYDMCTCALVVILITLCRDLVINYHVIVI